MPGRGGGGGRPASRPLDLSIGGRRTRVGIFDIPIGSGDGEGLGRGTGGVESKLRNVGVVNELYETIDHALIYPDDLRDRGEEGAVRAVLHFSPEGEYLRRASSFDSSSRYLRVYISRTLRRLFEKERGPKTKSGSTIHCTFDFAIDPRLEWTMVERTEKKFKFDGEVLEVKKDDRRNKFADGSRLYFYREHNPWNTLSVVTIREKNDVTHSRIGANVLPLIETAVSAIGDLITPGSEDPLSNYKDDPDW